MGVDQNNAVRHWCREGRQWQDRREGRPGQGQPCRAELRRKADKVKETVASKPRKAKSATTTVDGRTMLPKLTKEFGIPEEFSRNVQKFDDAYPGDRGNKVKTSVVRAVEGVGTAVVLRAVMAIDAGKVAPSGIGLEDATPGFFGLTCRRASSRRTYHGAGV